MKSAKAARSEDSQARVRPLSEEFFMYVLVLIAMALAPDGVVQTSEEFRYSVERDKTFRDEPGELTINASGISYKSQDGETLLRIPFADVYEADVSDRSVIR